MDASALRIAAAAGLVLAAAAALSAGAAGAAPPAAEPARPLVFDLGPGPPGSSPLLVLFSDFSCPPCARLAPVLARLRAGHPDAARILFRHAPGSDDPGLLLAHQAALAAGRQGRFWEMHDFIQGTAGAADLDRLIAFARALELDLDEFLAELAGPGPAEEVELDCAEAAALGIDATPTLLAGRARLVGAAAIEGYLADLLAAGRPEPPRCRPETGSAPGRGPPDSPLTVVEFGDLGCGACAAAARDLEVAAARFPGRIRHVFMCFPVDPGQDSDLAHRAALAAAEQDRFWELRDRLHELAGGPLAPELLAAEAAALGLDPVRFRAALAGPTVAFERDRQRAEGERLGVRGTPTFFVNGRRIEGRLPAEEFVAVLASELTLLEDRRASVPPAGEARP